MSALDRINRSAFATAFWLVMLATAIAATAFFIGHGTCPKP